MPIQDAALSYVHFIFAFVMIGALSAEAFVLRLPVDGRVARLLLRIDLFYAIAAVGVIVAGVSRALWGAKGGEYYASQPLFWAKVAVLAVIGLCSIPPTRSFIRWNRTLSGDASACAEGVDVRRTRRWVMIELHLLALVPLFAALMARAIGS